LTASSAQHRPWPDTERAPRIRERSGGSLRKSYLAATDHHRRRAHFARDESPDFHVRLRAPIVFIARVEALDFARERLVTVPFFSYALAAGSTNIGLRRGLGQEHVLHHEEARFARHAALQRIRADDPEARRDSSRSSRLRAAPGVPLGWKPGSNSGAITHIDRAP